MANFYVTTGGNDSTGDGSIGTPWASLHKACSVVSGVGDIINVAAGSYTDNTQCNLAVGVKIVGAGKAATLITTSTNQYILASTAVPVVTGGNEISGISITGSVANAILLYSHGRADQLIHDCAFTTGRVVLDGIAPRYITPADGSETGTAISAAPDIRFSVEPASTDWATGCEIYNNTCVDLQFIVHTIKGGLIHDNTIDNSGAARSCWGNTSFFWHSTEFYNNEFHVNTNTSTCIGLEVWNIEGDCKFYNNRMDGWVSLLQNAHGTSSPWSFEVYDNDFSSDVTHVSVAVALEVGYELENVLIERNYFSNTGANLTYQRCVAIWGQGVQKNYHIRNNIFYTTDGAAIIIQSTLATAGGLANPANIDDINIYNNIFDTGGTNGVLITNTNANPAAQAINGVIVRNNYTNTISNVVGFAPNPPTGNIGGNFCDHNQKATAQSGYVQSNDASFTIASNVSGDGQFRAYGSRWLTYYRPIAGSNLIAAGVDVGLPFTGAAPAIGAFEYEPIPTASPVVF